MLPETILIIDDEDDIREVASLTLELLTPSRIVSAASGEEGIALAETIQPDLILLDVMMPGLDGPTTFARLSANPKTSAIPVILLTAKVQAVDRRRFAELGVAGVVAKPFDPMTLHQHLAGILAGA